MKPAVFSQRALRDGLVLLLVATIPALLVCWLHPKRPAWAWHKPGMEEVELATVNRWNSPVLWVDARERTAYEQEHIPGAVLLNESEWNELLPGFLDAWKTEARVVVYCNSQECDASQSVALRLQRDLKLSSIYVLKGGWSAWKQRPQ